MYQAFPVLRQDPDNVFEQSGSSIFIPIFDVFTAEL